MSNQFFRRIPSKLKPLMTGKSVRFLSNTTPPPSEQGYGIGLFTGLCFGFALGANVTMIATSPSTQPRNLK